jgi:hypothetical protein
VYTIMDPMLLSELHRVLTFRLSNEMIPKMDESSKKAPKHGFEAGFQVVTVRDRTLKPLLAPKRNAVGTLDSVGKS